MNTAVKEMTIEELSRLHEIEKEAKRLGAEVLKIYGKHYINEEARVLWRVTSGFGEAEVGIRHFLHESITAIKWRKE